MHRILGSMLFALALPIAAVASPVEIVTRSTGTMQPDSDVLAFLGLAAGPGGVSQPYEMTLHAIVDPNAAGFSNEPWRSGVAQHRTQVSIEFEFGTQHLAFQGIGDVFLGGGSTYAEAITFPPENMDGTRSFVFENYIAVAGFNFGNALTPPMLTDVNSGGTASGAGIQTYIDPLTPHGLVSMNGQAQTVSINPVSTVPEPAHAAMLAGGLLALLGMGRRRHVS